MDSRGPCFGPPLETPPRRPTFLSSRKREWKLHKESMHNEHPVDWKRTTGQPVRQGRTHCRHGTAGAVRKPRQMPKKEAELQWLCPEQKADTMILIKMIGSRPGHNLRGGRGLASKPQPFRSQSAAPAPNCSMQSRSIAPLADS